MRSPTDLPPAICPGCGSVFWAHTCQLLPDWIALAVTRGNRRRAERSERTVRRG